MGVQLVFLRVRRVGVQLIFLKARWVGVRLRVNKRLVVRLQVRLQVRPQVRLGVRDRLYGHMFFCGARRLHRFPILFKKALLVGCFAAYFFAVQIGCALLSVSHLRQDRRVHYVESKRRGGHHGVEELRSKLRVQARVDALSNEALKNSFHASATTNASELLSV